MPRNRDGLAAREAHGHATERKWENPMTELGSDATVLDPRRVSALLGINSKEVARLGAVGDDFLTHPATVISYSSNETERARQREPQQ